ncbi:MAG: YkvA family protein [Oscillospiraceae bacterium]
MEQKDKFPYISLFMFIGAVIYIFSPLDLIPDAFIGLGQLDDVGMFYMAYRAGKTLYSYGKNRSANKDSHKDVVADVTSKDSPEGEEK